MNRVMLGVAVGLTCAAVIGTKAPAADAPPVVPPREGKNETMTLFDGKTLDGWDGSPQWWSVKDGVIVAKADKAPTTFLISKKSFSDFRLTLSSRVVESRNHAGVCFWGEHAVQGSNLWAYKGLLVIFPGLGLWDYTTNKGIKVDNAVGKKVTSQNEWVRVEILAQGNRVRVAYNGTQVLDWREPNPERRKEGPVCLQLHGHKEPQEVHYKDVVIETFPKEDRLLTVKPDKP
jgi:hypothetical protein